MFELIGKVVFALLIADFITGFLHWMEQTYCTEGMPLIGKSICEPNIDHHINPRKFGDIFIGRNYIQWISAVLFGLITYFTYGPLSLTFILILLFSSFGNEVHAWQHGKVNNWLIHFLFRSKILLDPAGHNKHHKPPYMECYCILLHINNVWLDQLNIWRKLEVIFGWLGLKPKRKGRRDYVKS